MIAEPRIAIAASPREWAQRLHRHVADHGGALVRATVLHPQDALIEDVHVFVVDDTTSFLSPRLVDELHRRGRSVLGVFDPEDPHGKGELLDIGADDVIERGAPPEMFVEAIRSLSGRVTGQRDSADEPGVVGGGAPERPRGRITVVAGAGGGVGATEVALGLAAAAGRRGEGTVLVDADDVAPALAQRLGVPLYPNIRAALDAMAQRSGTLADVLTTVRAGRFTVLPGLASTRSWKDLRPFEVADLLTALALVRPHVLAKVGHRIEELPVGPGGGSRYALARHLLGAADGIVVVATPTPVGVARLLEWLADTSPSVDPAVVHVAVNRAPSDRYRRGEIVDEIERSAPVAGVWFLPSDDRLTDAAWRGGLATSGGFARAVARLADSALPAAGRRGRRWPWKR